MSTGKVEADRDTLRSARVRLNMTQDDLAKASGVSRVAIARFESGQSVPHQATREAIQAALEARGIVFTNGDRPGFYLDRSKAIIPT